jgi:dsRNA-specific ribonuclease
MKINLSTYLEDPNKIPAQFEIPIKILGDIFESFVGAIFYDSGYNI